MLRISRSFNILWINIMVNWTPLFIICGANEWKKHTIHSSLVFIFCGFTLIFRQIAKKNFLITIRKHFCSRDDSSNLCFNFRFLVQRFIWFYVLFFSYKIKMKKNMQTSYCYSCKLIYFFVKVRDHQKCIPAINRSQIELNKTLRKSPINNFKS